MAKQQLKELINFASQIKLKISGRGNKNIIYNSFQNEPSNVKIEGVSQSCRKVCNFQRDVNNVILYFSSSINTCENMFYLLEDIIEIDLSNFDFSNIQSTENMFLNCTQLKKIEFGDIKTTSLTNMNSMFARCSNLESIDLSKFNTNKIKYFQRVFFYCINIVSINLGNIDTSSATSLRSFFEHCESLISIDVSSFITSSVTDMNHMFFHCYSLKIIIFPEILDVTKVTNMDAMFSFCYSLTALDLSQFKLTVVSDTGFMFHNCKKLKYINLPNFPPIKIKNILYMFRNLTSLVYLNIKNIDKYPDSFMNLTFEYPNSFFKICSQQTDMINYLTQENLNDRNQCSNICFRNNIKIPYDSNECITSCKNKGYEYEYLNICYHSCPDFTHAIYQINNNNALICLDKNPEGYYLDTNGFYKNCYQSCKFCYGPGTETDHNCKECKTNYFFFDDSFYENNCYQKCSGYYYDNNHMYHCAVRCSGEHSKLIINTNKCMDSCENDNKYKYEYNNICYEECNEGIDNNSEGKCFDTNIYQYIDTATNEIIGDNEEIYERIINKGLPNFILS